MVRIIHQPTGSVDGLALEKYRARVTYELSGCLRDPDHREMARSGREFRRAATARISLRAQDGAIGLYGKSGRNRIAACKTLRRYVRELSQRRPPIAVYL